MSVSSHAEPFLQSLAQPVNTFLQRADITGLNVHSALPGEQCSDRSCLHLMNKDLRILDILKGLHKVYHLLLKRCWRAVTISLIVIIN